MHVTEVSVTPTSSKYILFFPPFDGTLPVDILLYFLMEARYFLYVIISLVSVYQCGPKATEKCIEATMSSSAVSDQYLE